MDEKLLEQLKSIPILCVEDEDGIRQIIVETLKYYFDEVYEAKDGEEAYEIYQEYKPKIILSDIQMKNCNGIEFVKRIRKEDSSTTIFMLTAYSNEEYLVDLINLNINHFILKPLNLKKLNEALLKFLNRTLEPIEIYEGIYLDLQKREINYNNETISLRKREKEFLQLLYEKKGSILSYEQIEDELWAEKEMTSHALKSFIKDLRHKLPVNVIKNVPQEGYTLAKFD
ncbi:response regulator transcription factor [Halarcobacter bivalviorum]|uniref:DNA-binding response regulator n=1 Tax=Halarcobacter bivalviorum TaxID=663364 RepID=A0AAX2AAF6_9BACT|nr:response regulator transcription factor [Halarcobacter bivalviorum]AXH11756.1 two-component system response regulator [Halarcobacter bivalviorum]RXK10884.1 DNA-binding response regulator [Halarcobacter bivalviorum]